MFDSTDNPFDVPDSGEFQRSVNSLESLRDFVLTQFAGVLARVDGAPDEMVALEHQRQFLSVEETENIVREHSAPISSGDGVYAVGGESYEEYKRQMLALLRALATRVLSNIMCAGVKQGLLDHEFDSDTSRFVFSITPEGQKIVDGYEGTDSNTSKPSNAG
jgi:hypothetical protein